MNRLICSGIQSVVLDSFEKGLFVENRVLLRSLLSDSLRFVACDENVQFLPPLVSCSPDTTFFSSENKETKTFAFSAPRFIQ